VFVMGGSGRTAVEAAIINSMSPGDKVLVGKNGNFGELMATISKEMGYQVVSVGGDWTKPIDPQEIEDALTRDPSIKTVSVVHNETATGVTNDIKAIAAIAHRHGAIVVVDGVSSVGGMPVNMDEWEIDICATGSQKCLMSPPGLSIIAVNQRCWDRVASAKSYRYYNDFRRMKELADSPTPITHGTSSVSLIRCLNAACQVMVDEGVDNVFARHARLAKATRLGVKALGLKLLPEEPIQNSNTLVTVEIENSVKIQDGIMEQYNLHLGRGLGKWAPNTFRIGVMGAAAQEQYIVKTLDLIGKYLSAHGVIKAPAYAGATAAIEYLAR
jgi:aspartate aminotransferase-like enzyme